MKRLEFFPPLVGDWSAWYANFGDEVVGQTAGLPLDAAVTLIRANEAKYLAYGTGLWLTQARAFSASATAGISVLQHGSGLDPYPMPAFTPPALPAGVTPVPPGAHDRLMAFVQDIKNAAGFEESIGQALRIIGAEAPPGPAVPRFLLRTVMGGVCECVQIGFHKHGHAGVFIESRRGAGPWESEGLGIDLKTPFLDERPLLVAGVPEVREYRLRFWDGSPNGDWSPIQRITVAPA